jgi:hypothetical protein
MDLAMVKQKQGETLRKYMQCFFDKRATVVDVTDKEVIDFFKDGLYHRRTFEDFGRRRPSSITKLKDMITSWADEEDKANAKYDAIRGKSKQNSGGNSNNNRDQGGRNNNNHSGPNRKRKPDNTVAAIRDLHWFRGSLHLCKGALCGFSSFVSVVCALFLSLVLSRMCGAVALA